MFILTESLISLIKILAILFGFVMALGALLTLTERKWAAFVQDRYGPMRAEVMGYRFGGLFHLVADTMKMMLKEDFIPEKASKGLHTLAPGLGFFPAMVIFAIIPFMDQWCPGVSLPVDGRDLCFGFETVDALNAAEATAVATFEATRNYFQIANLNAGLLYIFAITGISVYGTALAGWSSNSKFSLLGGLRASAQMISYEVSMGLSLAGLLMIYGTIDVNEMVREQGTLLFGAIPNWGIFTQPLAFLLFLTAAIAESKRAPFDMPEAESELVAGYFTEYSAMKFGIFMIGEFIMIVFIGAIVSTLFLGGWQVPWLYSDGFHFTSSSMMAASSSGAFTVGELQAYVAGGAPDVSLPYWLVALLRVGAFVTKILLMIAVQLQIRWTLPRFRYDQIMNLGWKILLPLSLANLFITAVVLLLLS